MDYLRWGSVRYLYEVLIVTVLPAVDGSQHAHSLEKQRTVSAQKLSNVILWTESATN